MAVDAARFGFFKIVEAASHAAVRQFAGYFGNDVGRMGDKRNRFVPLGDCLHDFDKASAVRFLHRAGGQAVDDFFETALEASGQHFENLAGIFGQRVAQYRLLFGRQGVRHRLLLFFVCG